MEKHGARATFFLEGARAVRDPALVRDLVAAGHGVGSHGWTHLDAWRHPRGAVADLVRGEAALEDLLGQPVRDVRPPYGRVTPGILRWVWGGGRRLVLWGLMPGDFLASRPPDRLARTLRQGIGPGRIVVLHDGPPAPRAAAALDIALPALIAGGLRFVPLPPPRR